MYRGKRIDYRTPVIKAQSYGLDEIFVKRLLCLLPYYIMKYEKALHEINENDEKLAELLKEYQWIYSHLMELQRVYDEGKAVGKSQGKLEAKKEFAFELFRDGMSCEKIAKYINESVDMVKQLEKEWKSQHDKKAVSV